jgi:hypothetical protein
MERQRRRADGAPGSCAGRVERPCSRLGAQARPARCLLRARRAPSVLTIPAVGWAPCALRGPACWSQPPRLRGQSQVLQDGAYPLRCRYVRQHLASASTARAREHVQGEPPAQHPGPVQTGGALLPRLLHRRGKGGALLLQPRLRPCLREPQQTFSPSWDTSKIQFYCFFGIAVSSSRVSWPFSVGGSRGCSGAASRAQGNSIQRLREEGI